MSKEIIDWARSKVQTASQKFRDDKNVTSVSMDDIFELDGKEEEIAPGVVIYTTKINDDKFIIRCVMQDGAVLSAHYHPDYEEIFEVKKGKIVDDYSGVEIAEGMRPYTFYKDIQHIPRAVGYTEIIITGTRA